MSYDYASLSVTDYGSVLPRSHFMAPCIRPLYPAVPRIAGPAFTVQLAAGDNLMLHAAIYEAPAGSVIVVDGVDSDYAVAGGNVCAVAHARGIRGFVIDGVIRDLDDIKAIPFPVFAKGLFPVPGAKSCYQPLGQTITCGSVEITNGDMIIADHEGVAVLPQQDAERIYQSASAKADKEAETSLEDWQASHQAKISAAVKRAKTKGQ